MAWHSGKPVVGDQIELSLQHIRENFAELEPLVPHITEILDSRIIDYNLDVVDPPNGWYVRWENGLQVCMVQFPSTHQVQEDGVYRYDAPSPAAFSSRLPVFSFASENQSSSWDRLFDTGSTGVLNNVIHLYTTRGTLDYPVRGIVIGVWE